ncbi:hypothetical protein Tco_0149831 [Tanacetum coccineum]
MDPVTLDATLLATQGSQQILVSFSREITRIAIDFLTPRSSTSEKVSTARPKLSTASTKIEYMKLEAIAEEKRIFKCWFHYHTTNGHQFTMSNRHQELASPEQTASELASPNQTALALAVLEKTATGKEISNPFMAGEDCWVLEDFTTYCCWFNIGAASEDLVLLRKIEENRLSL